MRKLILCLLVVQQAAAQQVLNKPISVQEPVDSMTVYNRRLSPHEMKQDLDLFLDIRKKANSGLYRYRTQKQIDSIYKWAYREIRKPLPALAFYRIMLQLTDFEGSCHNYTEPAGD